MCVFVIVSSGGCIVVSFVSTGGRFLYWDRIVLWVEYFCLVGCCLACVCYGVVFMVVGTVVFCIYEV